MPFSNLQPTSSPYSADLLRPHDRKLAWVKEFGTNTTQDIGDAFQTGFADTGDADALIDARFGTLAMSTMGLAIADTVPKGRNFLMPPWSSFEDAPVFGVPGLKLIVIYASVYLFQESDFSLHLPNSCGFILGGEDLIGQAPTEPFMQFNIAPVPPAAGVRVEHSLQMEEWNIGGAGMVPNPFFVNPAWGSNLYFRFLVVGDGVKETSGICEASRDGWTWTNMGTFGFSVPLRRLGLSIIGREIGGLNFLRIYNYPATSADEIFEPPPPPTGSRLYTP